uniref:NADH-ubiquinone oxidoreductase chain 5 n=1 Tax=Salinator rhamphidia TaxID=981055 RepID=G8HR47_9GAST|nr:NADH dehydrogenase subunit 5 [Salinator rhamphidia]AEQ93893.1 NADH dehydrogenase subunit 5 [Salinator rhamphidia]
MSLNNTLRMSVLLYSAMVVMAVLFFSFVDLEKTMIVEIELFNLSGVPFTLAIVADKVSLSFGMVVTLISGCVFAFACKYMNEDPMVFRFLWILLAFVVSMNLLIFSGSVFFLLLGWDGLGITSFALIIYYQSNESLSAGFQTLMANRVGDALIVASMFLFAISGQLSYICVSSDMAVLVLLLCVAALTKSAQYPFSSWLPAAMAAPTPVSALVHSSTLVTAGIYLVIRLCYNVPLSESALSLLIFCGAVTCLLGGWAATFENDVKKIIALSTLSQLGVMVFSLGMGFPTLALFHLFTHALFKALLFLAAGTFLMSSFGGQDIRLLGGIGAAMPFAMVIFNVSSLCLGGAPFLSAFYSKHMILEKKFLSGMNCFGVIIMLVATMMTAKYVFRVLKAVGWSKMNVPIVSLPQSLLVTIPMGILAVGGIAGGKFFSSLDISNLEVAFIPSSFSSLINMVTVVGVISGILLVRRSSSYALSTLFFLTPLFSLSTKMLSPLLQKLYVLDYGWLEPAFLVKSNLLKPGMVVSQLFSWPFKMVVFLRSAWVLFFILIAYTFII